MNECCGSETNCADVAEDCCCCPGPGGMAEIRPALTTLSAKDKLGAWKVRWGIGRMNYTVAPGLYTVGEPDGESPVLVSANYKLTFDTLRKNLVGVNCWLLILDTKGINVWCAAGKGTFGTAELANRIEAVGLSGVVTHRNLILPQLGASGVSAHEIKKLTGFSVTYGPVRACDIRSFIASGCKATPEMRTVNFTLRDRVVLTPIELVEAAKISVFVFGVLFLLNLFIARPFGAFDAAAYFGTVLVGSVVTPALLPFIPGRAFAWKGWLLGMIWAVFAVWVFGWFSADNWMLAAGYLLILPAVSGFFAMNFTGCSTYTSPSGVLKEMRLALPPFVVTGVAGAVLILIKSFIG